MIRRALVFTVIFCATASLALADAKDDVNAAVQKLADASSYSWSSTIEGGFGAGTTTGKFQKDVGAAISIPMRDTSYDIVVNGDKGAVKTDDGWKSAAELAADNGGGGGGGGGFNLQRFLARIVQNYRTPVQMMQDILAKSPDFTKADDAYTADLSADQAKDLFTFGRRRGNNANTPAPEVTNPKATVKLWITDGAVSKSQIHLTGTMSFNGNDTDVDRTTTVEFKDVGSTTVDIPAEAKTAMEAPPASQPAQ